MMLRWAGLVLSLLAWGVLAQLRLNCERDEFELDGRPFRYVAGELHYFRVPRALWQDRLYRVRALGMNVVQVYAAWNWHEQRPGQ